MNRLDSWPALPAEWAQTQGTLHLWLQMLGKLRLAASPVQNHFWHSTLYVSTRGLTTSPIPYGSGLFEVEFDFRQHTALISTSWGQSASLKLKPESVAEFYAELMASLRKLGINLKIWTRPVEVADPIPFEHDTVHASYDPAAATVFWHALIQVDRVFKEFRGRFLGKSSPSHFFWGAFDLAVTRFSGRRAPMWNGQAFNVHPHVMHESYSHEVSSAGFWTGNATAPAGFYSYAVPEPTGFREAAVSPRDATYNTDMGEWLLPYESVRMAEHPALELMSFLQTTYAAAADLGKWDRVFLEQRPNCACDLMDAKPMKSRHPS
jgi:uncharacterized protein DUF5996